MSEDIINLCSKTILFVHTDGTTTTLLPHPTPIKTVDVRTFEHTTPVQYSASTSWPVTRYAYDKTIVFPDDLPASTMAVILDHHVAQWFAYKGKLTPLAFDVFALHEAQDAVGGCVTAKALVEVLMINRD